MLELSKAVSILYSGRFWSSAHKCQYDITLVKSDYTHKTGCVWCWRYRGCRHLLPSPTYQILQRLKISSQCNFGLKCEKWFHKVKISLSPWSQSEYGVWCSRLESSSARLAAVCVYDVKVSRGLNFHTVHLRSLSGWGGGKEDNMEMGTKSRAQLDGQCQVGGAGGGCKGEKELGVWSDLQPHTPWPLTPTEGFRVYICKGAVEARRGRRRQSQEGQIGKGVDKGWRWSPG